MTRSTLYLLHTVSEAEYFGGQCSPFTTLRLRGVPSFSVKIYDVIDFSPPPHQGHFSDFILIEGGARNVGRLHLTPREHNFSFFMDCGKIHAARNGTHNIRERNKQYHSHFRHFHVT